MAEKKASVICEMFRDGYGCEGRDHVYLVLFPDEGNMMLCGECISRNKKSFEVNTHVYEIGDDVSHYFL